MQTPSPDCGAEGFYAHARTPASGPEPRAQVISRSGGIDAQHFDEVAYLGQVTDRVARGSVAPAEYVDVEVVLPRMSLDRARFDLAQADVTQGEDAERLKERTRNILHREGQRGLIGARRHALVPRDQEE